MQCCHVLTKHFQHFKLLIGFATTKLKWSFRTGRTQNGLVCDNDDPTQDENKFMKVPCVPFAMSVSCDQSAHCSSGTVRGDLTSSQWARSTSLPPTPPTTAPAPLRPAPTLTSEGESLLDYARTRQHTCRQCVLWRAWVFAHDFAFVVFYSSRLFMGRQDTISPSFA